MSKKKLTVNFDKDKYLEWLIKKLKNKNFRKKWLKAKASESLNLKVIRDVGFFCRALAENLFLMNHYFLLNKKEIWTWLTTRDPRCDNGKRTPLEVLWQDGERGIQKIKDFISSYLAGDYA